MTERSNVNLAILVLGLLAIAGCAATNIDRAKDVSSAGIAYSQAAASLIDVAIDAEIDADSEAQLRANSRAAGALSEDSKKEMKNRLEQLNSGLIKNVVKWKILQANINALEAYFTALQLLANGSQADPAKSAVESLAGRLNSLNATLEGSKPLLSDAQKTALGGLTKIVATQIHGAIVGAAMERDAETVGKALYLQEHTIEQAENAIVGQLGDANARFYVDKVLSPYQNPPLQSAWVANRRSYIKLAALGQVVSTIQATKAAAKQMQKAWAKILSGERNISEMNAMLKETQELLAAAIALKQAEKPKAPAASQ